MKILRTPDERFLEAEAASFPPHYIEVDGLRIHYFDEGPRDGKPVLLMHGEPSWAYLYRKMIPVLVAAGHRTLAPDLVGFGRSDKPAQRDDYTYERHVRWMTRWLETVELQNVTLVCQDWGSLIGLRVAAENQDRFARIVLANGGLPTGSRKGPMVFRLWQAFASHSPWFPIGRIMAMGCRRPLSREAVSAYEAPFPNRRYKAGSRAFPGLVPSRPDDPAAAANRRAWEVFAKWEKPFLTAFSNGDPITRGMKNVFLKRVPGTVGQPHTVIRGAGHFLQEDKGEELAAVVADFIQATT
ncbi:MAG: haloalkane dehalogenase [Acidobacteriota bacterium]|nr:haloalkane dehalogenase [Acidobacteriota bacterium]